jgi:hypothetical protein
MAILSLILRCRVVTARRDTHEQAIENIKDAIRLHVEDRLADGEEIPEHVSVSPFHSRSYRLNPKILKSILLDVPPEDLGKLLGDVQTAGRPLALHR